MAKKEAERNGFTEAQWEKLLKLTTFTRRTFADGLAADAEREELVKRLDPVILALTAARKGSSNRSTSTVDGLAGGSALMLASVDGDGTAISLPEVRQALVRTRTWMVAVQRQLKRRRPGKRTGRPTQRAIQFAAALEAWSGHYGLPTPSCLLCALLALAEGVEPVSDGMDIEALLKLWERRSDRLESYRRTITREMDKVPAWVRNGGRPSPNAKDVPDTTTFLA